jgi:hypothetical protein
MTEESEKRENVSLHRKGDMTEVEVNCNLPIMIKLMLIFEVK